MPYPSHFEVFVEIVYQIVVLSKQGVVRLNAIGDVGFTREARIVALVLVKAGRVLVNAHSAAGTDLVAIVKAGRLRADPAREILAYRGRGECQRQQEDQ
jgi:hypothetical protein